MTELVMILGAAAFAAALISWGGTGLAVVSGPCQAPQARSNHVRPTPISGGLGVALGVAGMLTLLALLRPYAIASDVTQSDLARLAHVLALSFCFAMIGAADDVVDLGPRLKLALFGVASGLLALAAGPVNAFPVTPEFSLPLVPSLAVAGTALWVLTVINAVNFMDGANGLVGGSTALAGLALAVVAVVFGAHEVAALGAVVAGGFAGFLPWNTPRARVFMGDAGSLFAGALLVGGGLMVARQGPPGAAYLAAVLIMPLLADALLTLVWRHRHGRPLMRAHSDHAYQRRLAAAVGKLESRHQRVSLQLWLRMAIVGAGVVAVAIYLQAGGPAWMAIGLLAASVVLEVALWFTAPAPVADQAVRSPTT